MKLIHQHDERDCGAACLSMIASHYGLKLTISKCREVTRTDKSGTNLYGLVDGAKQLGLYAEPLSGTPDELLDSLHAGTIRFPFIAHIITEDAMLHFVVVEGFRKDQFCICDPGKGKISLSQTAFFQIWTGYLVTFEKTAEFQKGNYVRGRFLKFFALLKGQYRKLVGVLLLSFVISAIGILGAFVFERVIDDFAMDIESHDVHSETVDECVDPECTDIHESEERIEGETLLEKMQRLSTSLSFHWIFIVLIGMYMLQALIQYIRGYLIVSVSKKIDMRLILSYYNHLLDLPISSIAVRQTGEYLSRFSDTSTIRLAISGATLTILIDSFMVVACGCILFLENRILFVVSLLMVLLYATIVLCYRKPIEKSNRKVMGNNASVQSYLKESVDGIETIKAACAGEQIKSNATVHFERFIQSVFRNSLLNISQDALADAVELIGTVLILWIGFSMVLAEQISVGSLITFYVLLSYFSSPIKNLIELQPTIQTAFVAADRLNDILDLECETSDSTMEPLLTIDSVAFKDVCFRYGNRELIIDGVSLSVSKGERIAVVGTSGCGKTTLAKLLLRFYEPEKGSVLINGKSIQSIDLTALRKSIAYVDQHNFLFADSVINNLKLGNPFATDEDVARACRSCNADEFIQQLPFGYDTPLDENGANLSGGQKQRLAIARALLKQPKLLILDEATSNLDSISATEIQRTIEQYKNDFACIVITHRLSTVQLCDRIYVVDQGKIVESGTHDELMKQGGKYAELLYSQLSTTQELYSANKLNQ